MEMLIAQDVVPLCGTEYLEMDESKYKQQHQLLRELLAGANLQSYLDVLINRLKVHSTAQLKYVEDDDLLEVGMTKPEVQRLMKLYRKQTSQPGTFSKLRKVCLPLAFYYRLHEVFQLTYHGQIQYMLFCYELWTFFVAALIIFTFLSRLSHH